MGVFFGGVDPERSTSAFRRPHFTTLALTKPAPLKRSYHHPGTHSGDYCNITVNPQTAGVVVVVVVVVAVAVEAVLVVVAAAACVCVWHCRASVSFNSSTATGGLYLFFAALRAALVGLGPGAAEVVAGGNPSRGTASEGPLIFTDS